MELIIWTGVLILSLAVLVVASDFFVEGAEKIGLGLGMSPFLVGVMIVGFGTSLPELVSSVVAVYGNHSEIVIGNALGSNITNIFLVLGIGAVVGKKFDVRYNLMRIDLPFLTGSSLILAFMVYDKNFTFGETLVCLVALVFYFWSTFNSDDNDEDLDSEILKAGAKDWIKVVVSGVMIFVGAKYTVDSVVSVADILQIGSEIIALSAVALGTSLPEVMVSISAARQGKSEMIVGNIIGSNIFNTFGVMGVAGLTGKLIIPENIVSFSLPVFVASTFMYFVITKDQKINRDEGLLLLVFYVFYIGQLFHWI